MFTVRYDPKMRAADQHDCAKTCAVFVVNDERLFEVTYMSIMISANLMFVYVVDKQSEHDLLSALKSKERSATKLEMEHFPKLNVPFVGIEGFLIFLKRGELIEKKMNWSCSKLVNR